MRKDVYVVGYKSAGNVVYGKHRTGVSNLVKPPEEDYAHPMTERQAKRAVKKMPCKGAIIFKLVEVPNAIINAPRSGRC